MTLAQFVETSVTNSSFQPYPNPDDRRPKLEVWLKCTDTLAIIQEGIVNQKMKNDVSYFPLKKAM